MASGSACSDRRSRGSGIWNHEVGDEGLGDGEKAPYAIWLSSQANVFGLNLPRNQSLFEREARAKKIYEVRFKPLLGCVFVSTS